MGQLDRFTEPDTPPSPRTMRVFSVVFPVLTTINAIATRRLEDILTALAVGTVRRRVRAGR